MVEYDVHKVAVERAGEKVKVNLAELQEWSGTMQFLDDDTFKH